MPHTSPTSSTRAIWQYRSLILTFAINDLKIRYRHSFLGFLWSLIEPLVTLAVLYFVFTYVLPNRTENYALYLFLGLITWGMFTKGTTVGMSSIMTKTGILTKVPLPHQIPVLSTTLMSFIMTLLEFSAFFIVMAFLNFIPPATVLLLPLILLLETVLVLGVSLILSVLNVLYTDIKHIWGLALHAGFFIAPIIYNIDIMPEHVRNWLYLNPMAGIIDLAHALVLGTSNLPLQTITYTILFPFAVLAIGYVFFRRLSQRVIEEL